MLTVVALALSGTGVAWARNVPKLTGRVVDQAGVLPAEAEARLARLLEAHERQTGQQFAVLTIDSLEGEPIEQFSLRVAEDWKLGTKKEDDGLLLVVAAKDRKVRIETGYGLEGRVTDALSSRIIRGVLAPAFREGDYEGGIEAALVALMQAASGDAPVLPEGASKERAPRGAQDAVLLLMMVFFVFPFLFGSRRGRRRGHAFFMGGGGSRGGGFGGGGGRFGGGGASGSW